MIEATGSVMRKKWNARPLQVNNTELHVIEEGNGTLAVCIHGTLDDYRTWQRQIPVLSKEYHVVAYSRRYHYPNKFTDTNEYSVELHAKDLASLIPMFTDSPAHLISASWGGNVALQLALTNPSLVRSIVLGEPPVLPLLLHKPTHKKLLDEFHGRAFQPAREAIQKSKYADGIRFFIDGVMGKGSYDSMSAAAHRRFLDNVDELRAETASHNYIPDFTTEDLRNIACPVFLINGTRSPTLFHAICDLLASCLPRVERATIADASHGIHWDNASAYNAQVLDFLARH